MRLLTAALLAAAAVPALAGAAELRVPTAGAASITGTRPQGMGDAFRAIASTNEAIFFNLAGMAQARKYERDASYPRDPGTHLTRFQASVVDAQTSRFATGVAYTRIGA